MDWKTVSQDQRYLNSPADEKLRIRESWFDKNIKSDSRFKPELEPKIRADLFGETSISQAPKKSFLEGIGSLFSPASEENIAKAQNISVISQKTGKKPQDIEKNYGVEVRRFFNPPEAFSPEDKSRQAFDQGFARGLIGTKETYPEFSQEHPVLSAIGEGAGNLAGLVGTAKALKGLGIGEKVFQGIVSKAGIKSIPIATTAAKAIQTGTVFGTKTAAEKALQLANQEEITLQSGKEIFESSAFGAGLGAVGSIAKPVLRIPSEMLYGYTTAKLEGADTPHALMNAAVFGLFGLTNLGDYSKEYKLSAINKITNTTAQKLNTEFGLSQQEAKKQSEDFIIKNVLKTTGETDVKKAWDKVLTSKEYNLKYFQNLDETFKTLQKAPLKIAGKEVSFAPVEITPKKKVAFESAFKEELDKELNKVMGITPKGQAETTGKPVLAPKEAQEGSISPETGISTAEPEKPVVVSKKGILAIQLKSGEIISDPSAKLHSDIISNKGINPDDISQTGYVQQEVAPKGQEDLYAEARKYKSAEEFIKNNTNKLIMSKFDQARMKSAYTSALKGKYKIGIVGDFIKDESLRKRFKDVLNVQVFSNNELPSNNPARLVSYSQGDIKLRAKQAKAGTPSSIIEIGPAFHKGAGAEVNFIHEVIHAQRNFTGRGMGGVAEESAIKGSTFIKQESKSQLTDIWNKAQGKFIAKPAETQPPVEPAQPIVAITGTGETKTRGLALGVEAKAVENKLTKGFGELPEYKSVDIQDQSVKAQNLVDNDYEMAKNIAMGNTLPPEGILPESVFVAVENRAIKEQDVELLRNLATSSSLTAEATAMGQRIRMLAERDEESPVTAINEIAKLRREKIQKKTKSKDLNKNRKEEVEKIRKEINKTSPTKETWESFIKGLQC